MTLSIIETAHHENITLFNLPPHTTHATQPLDKSIFKLLKAAFGSAHICSVRLCSTKVWFSTCVLSSLRHDMHTLQNQTIISRCRHLSFWRIQDQIRYARAFTAIPGTRDRCSSNCQWWSTGLYRADRKRPDGCPTCLGSLGRCWCGMPNARILSRPHISAAAREAGEVAGQAEHLKIATFPTLNQAISSYHSQWRPQVC